MFLVRDAFVRMNHRAIVIMFVRLSVCLPVRLGQTCALWSYGALYRRFELWFDSPMFWAPWHQSMPTYSQSSSHLSPLPSPRNDLQCVEWDVKHYILTHTHFFQFHLGERWGMDGQTICVISQERLTIEVKLLLNANIKSYMPLRLAQQRMTLNDLEWRKINIVRIACYLCGSRASCLLLVGPWPYCAQISPPLYMKLILVVSCIFTEPYVPWGSRLASCVNLFSQWRVRCILTL